MILFQIFTILFAIFMMYVIRIHRNKDVFDSFEYGAWIAIWIGFIFLSIFPQTMSYVAEVLHIGRVFDAIVIFAFMILGTITIFNRISIKKLEKKLERTVRKQAIDDARSTGK